MGGLVARAYLRRFGGGQVAKLVTLGTPHAGSQLARFGRGQNARQMEPGSAWLQALASAAPAVETVLIYSPHDSNVVPQSNLELAGATSVTVDGVGHLSMLFSKRVASVLLSALEMPEVASAGWKLRRS
jgi:triacylglycerol lipase